jgi:gamma-glutamyltranspeptidase/glutathione hydrolase
VSIPGAIDAWDTILRDHGKMGLDTLLQPAIKAAEEGYIVAPRIAFDWKNQFEKLKNGTNTERYLLPHGKPAVAGDVIRQPELGKTLRAIARKRPRCVLQPARSRPTWWKPCAASAACTRWKISPRHSTETTSPIGTMYKGHDVWQCPPNGPGITMLVMLNILSRFDLTKFKPLSVERFHLEAEAARIAYLMREQYIGDPQQVHVDVAGILARNSPRSTSRISRWTGCSTCRTSRRR